MTPMHFEKGGAGNNFLGISPIKNTESHNELEESSKKSSTIWSVSY